MGILDTLRGLFGGSSGGAGEAAAGEPVDYNGYRITPAPQRQASGWNTAGVIAKTFDDGIKEHRFIRVDTHASRDDAIAFSITKAQQIIDEQGDRLFVIPDPKAAPANLLPRDGAVFLFADALARADADRLFAELQKRIEWRQEVATVMGRRLPIPRLTAWHGAAGYVYSGIRMTPAPWTPALLELKDIAEALAGQPFNSVLLNLYRDGRDSVSWHADNEPGLGQDPVIASLSLGAIRRFQLKHRRSGERLSVDLPHGSCLLMAGATQHHWLHQLPKTAQPVGARINLTFRRMG